MSEPVSEEEKAVAHLVKFMEGFYIAIIAALFWQKIGKTCISWVSFSDARGSVLTLEHFSYLYVSPLPHLWNMDNSTVSTPLLQSGHKKDSILMYMRSLNSNRYYKRI